MSLYVYLVRHTLGRWWENPWSPLARLTVAALMATLLSGTSCIFEVSTKILRLKLQKSGADTIVVNRTVVGGTQPSCAELFSDLKRYGATMSLKRCFQFATGDLEHRLTVYAYNDKSFAVLSKISGATSAECFVVDKGLPEGLRSNVNLQGRLYPSEVIPAEGMLHNIPGDSADGLLLLPESYIQDLLLETGYTDVFILLKEDPNTSVPQIVDILNHLNRLDRLNLNIFSASAVMREIEELEKRRSLVVPALVELTGAIIFSVFAAISTLEYRDNRYIFALLRSMGAPAYSLFLQFFAEGVVVVSAGAGLAAALAQALLPVAAGFLKFPEALPFIYQSLHSPDLLKLLLGTMLGAVGFSCIPIIPALRRRIGLILS
jgi:hypothetical protein